METVSIHDNRSSFWTTKYKPINIKQIVGNQKAVKSIHFWLSNFFINRKKVMENLKFNEGKKKKDKRKVDYDDSNETSYGKNPKKKNGPYSCLLLSGNHGVGKSCSVYAIINDLGFEIKTIDFTKIQKFKNINELVNKITKPTDIISIIENKRQKKMVLVIDEVESISSKNEVSCIMGLIESNEQYWHYPIIFISNNQHNKVINEIKKKSLEVKMWEPFPSTMKILLNRIAKKENIMIKDEKVKDNIVEHSQRDFRRLVNILQDIKYIYNEKIIDVKIFTEYCNSSKRKDIDYDLFKASKSIIHNYSNIDQILRYYEIDKVNLPLMMQDNYIKTLNKYSNNDVNLAENITRSLSKGDIIENYIYGNQNWNIHEVHGYYSCIKPSFMLKEYIDSQNREHDISFPTDLNRTSIKRINKKNILKINEYFDNMNIYDYVYINHLVRKLISDNNIDECVRLFKSYDLTLDNIDKLLKIDKIKGSKIILTSKQKREITKKIFDK